MINKNGKVGDFVGVPIFEISKVSVRTKIEDGQSSLAISNNPQSITSDAKDDELECIDMLIVGDEKALRWLAGLLIEQADLLKSSKRCFINETEKSIANNKTDN